jgi:hypothetical protein
MRLTFIDSDLLYRDTLYLYDHLNQMIDKFGSRKTEGQHSQNRLRSPMSDIYI